MRVDERVHSKHNAVVRGRERRKRGKLELMFADQSQNRDDSRCKLQNDFHYQSGGANRR